MAERLRVFLHTNREVRAPPPAFAGLDIVPGWFNTSFVNRQHSYRQPGVAHTIVDATRQEIEAQQRLAGLKPWNLLQTFKYEWLLRQLQSYRREDEEWILADMDTLFLCDAPELRERFRRFGTELVVSVEKQRRGIHRPLPTRAGENTEVSWAAQRNPDQPNSGLLMGTNKGAEQLLNVLQQLKNSAGQFPCCPLLYADGTQSRDRCAADDQLCLYAALGLSRGGTRPPSAELEYRLDVNATLFATPSASEDSKGLRFWLSKPENSKDGKSTRRMGYRVRDDPKATATPCVVHLAGSAKLMVRRIMLNEKMTESAWMPWNISYGRFDRFMKPRYEAAARSAGAATEIIV